MKGKQLIRSGLAVVLAAAMTFTSIPVAAVESRTPTVANEKGSESVKNTAIAYYDFDGYTLDGDNVKDGEDIVMFLDGDGTKPTLTEDPARGTVLSLTKQKYPGAWAKFASSPFASVEDLDNGLTINFWTKADGAPGGAANLLDFEVAPADTGRAGTFAINQGMIYWNTTDQDSVYTDFNIGDVKFSDTGWKMVSIVLTKTGLTVYSNGQAISHTVAGGTEDYETMMQELVGSSEKEGFYGRGRVETRLGASGATYWDCAGAYMDDVSFYGKALSAEQIAALYTETGVAVKITDVTVSGKTQVQVGKTIKLTANVLPADATEDKTVTWVSSDDTILTVDEEGNVRGIKEGAAKVTAKAANVESAEFAVTVIPFSDQKVSELAIAAYDFEGYKAEENSLKKGDTSIELKTMGNGVKPALKEDEVRGQVLSLTKNDYSNSGYALLANPFEGKDAKDGFTVNFWTKATGDIAGGNCIIDFDLGGGEADAADRNAASGSFAINQGMVYWNTTNQNGNYTDFNVGDIGFGASEGWKMVTICVTQNDITFYGNGSKITKKISSGTESYAQMINDLTGGLCKEGQNTSVRLGSSVATYWNCAGALLDDITFYAEALGAEDVKALFNEQKVDVSLANITINGKNSVEEEKTVQLSAAFEPVDATVDRDAVEWTSSDPSILTVDGKGLVKGIKKGKATVTAKLDDVTSAPFEIEVLGCLETLEPGNYLTVYTTKTPFYAEAANLNQETQSVYFAVSKDGKNFEVLNNGGGVIFASKGSGRIVEPKIFKENGKFVVVAQDATASNGFHVFTSDDGVHYYTDVLETNNTRVAEGLLKSSFTFELDGENLAQKDTNFSVGNAVAITEEEYQYLVNKLGTVVNTGLEKLPDLTVNKSEKLDAAGLTKKVPSVNATYSDGSAQSFKIDWEDLKDVNGKTVDLTKEGEYDIVGKVIQTKYLNQLKELNGSELPEDDPENVNPEEPDNYDEATGETYYDATKFVEGMADPCIYWDEKSGYYYMTGSYFPEAGDEIDENDKLQQYDRVVLRRSKTLEGLQNRSEQVTIWKVGNQGFDSAGENVDSGYRYIWAPEIHRVGDYWVVYFTESHSKSDVYNIFCHALVLDGDKDPYETALTAADEESQWQDYRMTKSDEAPADPFKDATFSLDMTYFKDAVNDESYVVWASKRSGNSDLYIATLDEEEPWKVTSAATCITRPDFGWEKVRYIVNEGPSVLQKDGNIYLCYSASGTGSEYAIGMLSAKGGEKLTKTSVWTKSPYPLLTSRDVDGEEGPGHNSFTVDKDGNAIFVYHARPTSHNYKHCGWDGSKSTYNTEPLNDPCRHARVKRVHWAADGTPILKMTYEEELLDENKTVTLHVKVTGQAPVTPTPVTPAPAKNLPDKAGTTETFGGNNYVVTNASSASPEVAYKQPADKNTKSVTIPKTITVKGVTYKVTAIADNAFKGNKKLKKVTIPVGITAVGKNAFGGCTALKSITIPEGVTTIGANAFKGNKSLKKIVIKSTVLKKVGKNAFKGIYKKATIKVPKKQKKAYQKLLKKKGQASGVKIK
ncbi:MAG: hypothetical protein E7294_03135 [Lachnospiraceae bacterium]|jgi:GH43 family beta-xylosidase/uncharacterized protein YjdB|nr:hypothetical protein [Lachnospiraceae bacterium]